MQSAYLCVIFHLKHKKSKIATIVGDVTGSQQRH